MIDIWQFALDRSLIDLWLQVMLRFCVHVCILLALLVNVKDTLARLKSLIKLLTLLLGFILMFTYIKLLVWSEIEENLYHFWFWLLFSWTLFSAILIILQCKLIHKIEVYTQQQSFANINDDSHEECKPLLDKMDYHEHSVTRYACKPNMHHGKKTTIQCFFVLLQTRYSSSYCGVIIPDSLCLPDSSGSRLVFKIQQAVYKNLPGHVVLIIAHRPSTVERSNIIIVIEKGCVVEEGNHKQLWLKKGLYPSLVHKQLLGSSEV